MRGASRDAGAAHDAGIYIVKLRIAGVMRLRSSRLARMRRLSRRHQPGMHVSNLLPERRHIHNQIFDDRQVAKRRDRDMPVPFNFFAERGTAGQLLSAVDRHRTRTANRRAARIAECQAPIALLFDANERVEHRHPAADVESNLLRMRCRIDFGVESLNRECKAHGRREMWVRGFLIPSTIIRRTSWLAQLERLGRVRQIAAPVFRDEHHVFNPYGAETGIVETGFYRDDVAFLEQ